MSSTNSPPSWLTYKEAAEWLLKSPASPQELSCELLAQYQNEHNTHLIDYLGEPHFAQSLIQYNMGQSLLTLALQRDDLPFIEKLIAQPIYQNNQSDIFPDLIHMSTCSEDAFELLFKAKLYDPSELQKSVYNNPGRYSINNLLFLLEEGYQLSLINLLNSTIKTDSYSPDDFVELFRAVAKKNGESLSLEFLLQLDAYLNEITEDQTYFKNTFMACAMVATAVLKKQPDNHYEEIGDKLANKVLYIMSLPRYFKVSEREEEDEIEMELLCFRDTYFTYPTKMNTPLIHEELQSFIQIKMEQVALKNKLHGFLAAEDKEIPSKNGATFKL